MTIRTVIPSVLCVCIVAGCQRTQLSTRETFGCGVGRYSGLPAEHRAARWAEPTLRVHNGALHVGANDAATSRAAVPLNVWVIQGPDTLKARTDSHGAAEFSTLAPGPAEVRTWFFNFASTLDSVSVRGGFRDTMTLRLGRTGNECLFVPDTGQRGTSQRRMEGDVGNGRAVL